MFTTMRAKYPRLTVVIHASSLGKRKAAAKDVNEKPAVCRNIESLGKTKGDRAIAISIVIPPTRKMREGCRQRRG